MGRAPCCDKANVKRGPWSPEEDTNLKNYIQIHGTSGNWISLPHKAGLKRCGKSCRLRWLNYLRPNIKHGEFSTEEDRVIFSLYASIGSRWSIIAAQLPGRTDNDIKNYWNTKLKKKLIMTNNSSSSNNNNNNKMVSSTTTTTTTYNETIKKYNQDDDHNPMMMIPSSISSLPLYQCTPTPFYNSPFSNNTTITMSFNNNNNNNNSNNNNTLLHPTLLTTMHEKDNTTLHNNNNDDNKIGIWGQNGHQSISLLDNGLEEIKQLISCNNTNDDNDDNCLDQNKFMFSEEDNSKVMMYYY